MKKLFTIYCLLAAVLFTLPLSAQRKKKKAETSATTTYDPKLYEGLEWRLIGPFRGGRSCAVTGVPGKPQLFYFGATGGGVWKTENAGKTWENISDGFFGGSIGAIAVSEYDNNVIYVGGGEKTVRGNVSYGYGMWKSVDAGKTWENIGLNESRHIGRVRVHPKNPDIVYAAVMGDLYKPTQERGVYKSTDGGKTWKKTLFATADAGAVDLVIDPGNPRVLYASTWHIRRTPYSLISGGEGSDLWKSTDGGDTWKKITENKGLPKGTWGIAGVAVSPVNSERIFAQIEAEEGGLYRSDDAGKTWSKVNSDRALRQRAWYYTRVYCDTKDQDVVYVLNVRYHKSTDGGKTFKPHVAPHGDHHDLWIAPEDPERMIIGDDGGAQISNDGGSSWSTYHNQPTAQFYRVVTDNAFPYRIYAAQQDNSTIRIAHRSTGSSISEDDWESTAGGESAHIAPSPENPDIVYGGSYGGFLTRVNHKTDEARSINVWPDNPMGYGAEGMKYRFQWNFPIFFSPHNPKKLYSASNHLHVTENGGHSWETISPDLTTNDSSKLGPSGGPITKDNTGVEYYSTIFAAIESPYEKDLLWTGSDDGLIHVSKDGGKTWSNVTPPQMPAFNMINSIEASPFVKGGAYVAATKYKSGDYRPYLYKTEDYGATWTEITSGIDPGHFTRVVRADPDRKGLLYAGTETGMYISFDDGANWQPFQQNLPIVPITDLTIKNKNLIAATQGRSLWIIDDLGPIHQLSDEVAQADAFLFDPLPAYRMKGRQAKDLKTAGTNHPGGVMTYFQLKQAPDSAFVVKLEFLEADGDVIKSFASNAKEKKEKLSDLKAGLNRFVWNTRYDDAKDFEGMILWWASMQGPKAVPGKYKVRLTVNEEVMESDFEILPDPRIEATVEDMQAQFDFLLAVRDKMTETHEAIINIRAAKEQIGGLTAMIKKDSTLSEVVDAGDELIKKMEEVEKTLYQTKNRSGQDPLNFPIQLNNKLGHLTSLVSISDDRPTEQAEAFRKEVTAKIDEQLKIWETIKTNEVPAFNKLVKEKSVDAIILEE
ncbi:glycosyl hydrolase [Flammeovirgaceae bacterium SG7u.111]|nr:glycosyl hydrolase [Flammeovirgaceae bacterium SG7u.132]WPO37665.1 glycosyl hydrolase [Flammeovirgaceae bacterium SG7u.111]